MMLSFVLVDPLRVCCWWCFGLRSRYILGWRNSALLTLCVVLLLSDEFTVCVRFVVIRSCYLLGWIDTTRACYLLGWICCYPIMLPLGVDYPTMLPLGVDQPDHVTSWGGLSDHVSSFFFALLSVSTSPMNCSSGTLLTPMLFVFSSASYLFMTSIICGCPISSYNLTLTTLLLGCI